MSGEVEAGMDTGETVRTLEQEGQTAGQRRVSQDLRVHAGRHLYDSTYRAAF